MNAIVEHLGVSNILHAMGVDGLHDKGKYFLFSSPFREDRNPSMVCYKNDGYCVDFGGNFSGPITRLYHEITGRDVKDDFGVEGASLFDLSFQHKLQSIRKDAVDDKGFPEAPKNIQEIQGSIKYDIRRNKLVEEYCQNRYLTEAFRTEFKIGYTDGPLYINGDKFQNRLLIPICEHGETLSYEARDFTYKSAKKVLYPSGGTVSTLFNYDNLCHDAPLIIVEGIMDMPKVWHHISKNVTTTFGIQLTGRQRRLLCEFPNIILFPDGDEGGQRFIQNVDNVLDYEFEVMWIDDADPGESTVPVITAAYENRKKVTEFLIDKMEVFNAVEYSW